MASGRKKVDYLANTTSMGKSWQAQSSTILANFNPGSNLRRVEALLNRTVNIQDAYRRGHFGLPLYIYRGNIYNIYIYLYLLRLQPEIRQVAPGGKSSSDESCWFSENRIGIFTDLQLLSILRIAKKISHDAF